MEFLVFAIVAYLFCIIPRAYLSYVILTEENKRTNPKYKAPLNSVLPMFIPYWGGAILCEQMGYNITKYLSYVFGILTIGTWVNVFIANTIVISESYIIISMYINVAILVANVLVYIILAFRCARTFESGWGCAFCFLPFISFFLQVSAVKPFFKQARYFD